MNDDVDRMVDEINKLCARWPSAIPDDAWPGRRTPPTRSYVSKVPQALNCLNRAAKEGSGSQSLDELYETKFRVLLVCARLGWARDASAGYQVDRFLFHSPGEIDCSTGNETRFVNLDLTKIDDCDHALAILEEFLAAHPLTTEEDEALLDYQDAQERERLAYEARCELRAEMEGETDLDNFEDDLDDERLVQNLREEIDELEGNGDDGV